MCNTSVIGMNDMNVSMGREGEGGRREREREREMILVVVGGGARMSA